MRKLALQLLYFSQLWRIFRWLRRKTISIRTYHGVTEFDVPNWTQLRAHEFEQQMRYLKQRYNPISLSTALDMISGRMPIAPYSVVVTFDDGFKNNATTAYPILKAYGIPSIVFLTTSFVDKDQRFGRLIWTDYIYCLIQNTKQDTLDLSDVGLTRYELRGPMKRYEAKGVICAQLKKLDYERKNQIIEVIAERLATRVSAEQEKVFGSLDWKDIVRIDGEQLMSFGAHTVNHEILSQLPDERAEWELTESQRVIQQWLGRPVPYFAYPNGQPEDFTDRVDATVREHYACALTTIPRFNRKGDDLYKLKRTGVGRGLSIWEFKLLMAGISIG